MFSCNTFRALVILMSINVNYAARILGVFPMPMMSHQLVFRVLTNELHRRGHELVIITTDPAFPKGETPKNITEIDVHDKSYDIWTNNFLKHIDGKLTARETVEIAYKVLTDVFGAVLDNDDVKNLIKKEEKFDLILLEAIVRSTLVMSHIFKAPVIQVSTLGGDIPSYDIHGAPYHPILYPNTISDKVYNLTNWDKIVSIYNDLHLRHTLQSLEVYEHNVLEKVLGEDVPTIKELSANVDMLFVNVHPIWEDNRPVPPGVIHIGGVCSKPYQELPMDLQNYLNSSIHGIIYMSFGSNVQPSALPTDRVQTFLNVFKSLPYDVLLKWDKDELLGKPKNVHIFKWLPQADLLNHPKIRLFITQGGLQSTDEAIRAGVPLIAFPMLADQWYNADKYVRHGIGIKLDIGTVTEEGLRHAITALINDDSYRENVIKLGSILKDQPQQPLERAMWWIEYVLRHGGAKHLRAPAANMPWHQFIELELILIVLVCLFFSVIVCSFCFYFIYTLLKNILNSITPKTKVKNN